MNQAYQQYNMTNNIALRAFAWLALAVVLTALSMSNAHAVDLMAGGAGTVKDTFGGGSTFSKWLILGEVIFGVFAYIKTKNLILLGGVAVVIAFTTIGFNLAA